MKKLFLLTIISLASTLCYSQTFKVNIDSIRVGELQQYPANCIYIEDFKYDGDTTINLKCAVVYEWASGSIQVPNSNFAIQVGVSNALTLGFIKLKCKAAIIAYSPLFKERL